LFIDDQMSLTEDAIADGEGHLEGAADSLRGAEESIFRRQIAQSDGGESDEAEVERRAQAPAFPIGEKHRAAEQEDEDDDQVHLSQKKLMTETFLAAILLTWHILGRVDRKLVFLPHHDGYENHVSGHVSLFPHFVVHDGLGLAINSGRQLGVPPSYTAPPAADTTVGVLYHLGHSVADAVHEDEQHGHANQGVEDSVELPREGGRSDMAVTDCSHDGDGEEQRLREGPRIIPIIGHVIVVVAVVLNHEVLQGKQILVDLQREQLE
jgi:hypothetical protein